MRVRRLRAYFRELRADFQVLRLPRASLLWIALTVFSLPPKDTTAQAIQNGWVTNGNVYTMARSGNTIYLGGYFSRINPATGALIGLDITTGALAQPVPAVVGKVFTVLSDLNGGWYLGGNFTSIQGQPRSNLARLDAAGHLTSWSPSANGTVYALAWDFSGTSLFAGGAFTSINNQPRNHLAAIDTSGSVMGWDPNANSTVYTIAVNGSTVYVGGEFGIVGGQNRNGIAAINSTTGLAAGWNPNAYGTVRSLVVTAKPTFPFTVTVYVGGSFSTIGSTPVARNCLAAIDATGASPPGAATAWDPDLNKPVYALAVSGGTIYAGGAFTTVGTGVNLVTRDRLAAIGSNALATSWDPSVNDTVFVVSVSAGTVYAGGTFTNVHGQTRNRVVAIDGSTGVPTSWDPNANGAVHALGVGGGLVYAGGALTGIGGVTRNNIAAIDASTGLPTSWDPNANGAVYVLAMNGDNLYVGGAFTSIGTYTRYCIACLKVATGLATNWAPTQLMPTQPVYALAVGGGKVYAGGDFNYLGGQSRSHIAALDTAATGNATSWNPNANNTVLALDLTPNALNVGGRFTSIGDSTRDFIASLDLAAGKATSWNPNANNVVATIARYGSVLYAGGDFTSIGGQTRHNVAALDVTGRATSWDPSANGTVWVLAPAAGGLYAGGHFTSIGGQLRNRLALLDIATGLANPTWDPDADDDVFDYCLDGGTVYFGGFFLGVQGSPHAHLAGVSAAVTGIESQPPPQSLLRAFPNPFRNDVALEFTLPQPEEARIDIYDLSGREVRRLERGEFPAGEQRVTWNGRDDAGRQVAAGMYVAAVLANGVREEGKILRMN
jgi:flagellar hook capping protein FlgD/beta-propeller uncharacterized protein DUF5122